MARSASLTAPSNVGASLAAIMWAMISVSVSERNSMPPAVKCARKAAAFHEREPLSGVYDLKLPIQEPPDDRLVLPGADAQDQAAADGPTNGAEE